MIYVRVAFVRHAHEFWQARPEPLTTKSCLRSDQISAPDSTKPSLATSSQSTMTLTTPPTTPQTLKTTSKIKIVQKSAQKQRQKLSISVSAAGQREEASRGHETAPGEIQFAQILKIWGFRNPAGRVLFWKNLEKFYFLGWGRFVALIHRWLPRHL